MLLDITTKSAENGRSFSGSRCELHSTNIGSDRFRFFIAFNHFSNNEGNGTFDLFVKTFVVVWLLFLVAIGIRTCCVVAMVVGHVVVVAITVVVVVVCGVCVVAVVVMIVVVVVVVVVVYR